MRSRRRGLPVQQEAEVGGAVARQRKKRVVILVNATEGEPGSAKDQMLLLRSPYLVLGGALVAAWALQAKEIVIGVTRTDMARSISSAASAEPDLKRLVRVVKVPERFVVGEGGALVNSLNGKAPVPPGRKVLPSDYGIHDLPTLLSNAETFAQVAVLAMLGAGRLRLGRYPGRTGNDPAHRRWLRGPSRRSWRFPSACRSARCSTSARHRRRRRPGRRLSRHVAAH